ncbi:hypothetical protein KQI84_09665 [bacterium]|nr:hypothetical protein [bacterium]
MRYRPMLLLVLCAGLLAVMLPPLHIRASCPPKAPQTPWNCDGIQEKSAQDQICQGEDETCPACITASDTPPTIKVNFTDNVLHECTGLFMGSGDCKGSLAVTCYDVYQCNYLSPAVARCDPAGCNILVVDYCRQFDDATYSSTVYGPDFCCD